jgi:hypothetical protein
VAFAAAEEKTIPVPTLEIEAMGEPPMAPPPATPSASTETIAPVAAPMPPAADPHTGQTQRTAGIIVGGAGVVAMGAGVILGLSAKGTYDDSSKYCDASGCDAPGLDLRDRAVGRGQVATALFALGAGTAVGGAVLWFTAPRARTATPVARIGLGASGVVVNGTW